MIIRLKPEIQEKIKNLIHEFELTGLEFESLDVWPGHRRLSEDKNSTDIQMYIGATLEFVITDKDLIEIGEV